MLKSSHLFQRVEVYYSLVSSPGLLLGHSCAKVGFVGFVAMFALYAVHHSGLPLFGGFSCHAPSSHRHFDGLRVVQGLRQVAQGKKSVVFSLGYFLAMGQVLCWPYPYLQATLIPCGSG